MTQRVFYKKDTAGGDLSLPPEAPPEITNNWSSFNPAQFSQDGTTDAITATSNGTIDAQITPVSLGYIEIVIPGTIGAGFLLKTSCDTFLSTWKPNGDLVQGGTTYSFFGGSWGAGDTLRLNVYDTYMVLYRNGDFVGDSGKHPPELGGDGGGAGSSVHLTVEFSGMLGVTMANPVVG
jgi:hypothetical protein